MSNLMNIATAIMGTISIVVALQALVPAGAWLYLAMLVLGTQMIVMAARSAIRS